MAADLRIHIDLEDLESWGALNLRLEVMAGITVRATGDADDSPSEEDAVEKMIERAERSGTP
jgi:hypothetical protein